MKKISNTLDLGRKKYYYIILTIFWIYIVFVFSPFDSSKGAVIDVDNALDNKGIAGEITGDTLIEQEFIAKEDQLSRISIIMADFNRKNSGLVEISLTEKDSGKKIADCEMDMSQIEDNSRFDIQFSHQEHSKDTAYLLKIAGKDGEAGSSVTMYISSMVKDFSPMIVNGQKIDGRLSFYSGYYSQRLQIFKIAVWLAVILLSYVFVCLFKKADEKTFLKLAFTMGICLVVITPFCHPIDEVTHFFRSYMIAQGDILDEIKDGEIGGYVSENYEEIILDKQLTLRSYFENPDIWNQRFGERSSFYVNPYAATVAPVNHLIGAIGVGLGLLLHMPIVFVIWLGRLANYIFYVMACYYAIKTANYYKTFYFIVAALPLSFWLAGSYSLDPILIAASLLFTSICLKHYFDKSCEMTGKEKIALLVCCAFIASVKYLIYTPVLLLFFLVPKSKFTKKSYIAEWCCAIGIVIVMVIVQLYLLKAFPFIEDRNGDVDVARQIKYMLHNIPMTVRNFANYFVSSSLGHIEGMNYYGCINIITPLIGLFAVFGASLEKNKYSFEAKEKKIFCRLSLFILIVTFSLMIASLYVGFTPIGKFSVEGLQSRYLIPVMIFLMFPISMLPIKNDMKHYEEKVSFIMGIGIMDMLAQLMLMVFA